jgi:hypothetical protein
LVKKQLCCQETDVIEINVNALPHLINANTTEAKVQTQQLSRQPERVALDHLAAIKAEPWLGLGRSHVTVKYCTVENNRWNERRRLEMRGSSSGEPQLKDVTVWATYAIVSAEEVCHKAPRQPWSPGVYANFQVSHTARDMPETPALTPPIEQ